MDSQKLFADENEKIAVPEPSCYVQIGDCVETDENEGIIYISHYKNNIIMNEFV